ncbi:VOC family protein [Xanthocytophaga agilis]|uniref:VOC family protein n=1 Tax=Xanthocytophaga agilis TaxID=3048010 RepID=A0AAE3R4I0_9BACT|nr:VOC family protein [Xanthocytophaga agilis]MDJ1503030.1 VOC family protein [Xanthocytophaga agilis]
MQQRVSVLTIGVDNLSAIRAFYREKIGWQPIAENKDILFIQMNGFLLGFTQRKPLADFIGISSEGTGFRSFTIGYNVDTKEEVTEWYHKLKKQGITILKEPEEASFGGHFFYFSDIEGNILEIAYNPYIELDNVGNVLGHASIDHL